MRKPDNGFLHYEYKANSHTANDAAIPSIRKADNGFGHYEFKASGHTANVAVMEPECTPQSTPSGIIIRKVAQKMPCCWLQS